MRGLETRQKKRATSANVRRHMRGLEKNGRILNAAHPVRRHMRGLEMKHDTCIP